MNWLFQGQPLRPHGRAVPCTPTHWGGSWYSKTLQKRPRGTPRLHTYNSIINLTAECLKKEMYPKYINRPLNTRETILADKGTHMQPRGEEPSFVTGDWAGQFSIFPLCLLLRLYSLKQKAEGRRLCWQKSKNRRKGVVIFPAWWLSNHQDTFPLLNNKREMWICNVCWYFLCLASSTLLLQLWCEESLHAG